MDDRFNANSNKNINDQNNPSNSNGLDFSSINNQNNNYVDENIRKELNFDAIFNVGNEQNQNQFQNNQNIDNNFQLNQNNFHNTVDYNVDENRLFESFYNNAKNNNVINDPAFKQRTTINNPLSNENQSFDEIESHIQQIKDEFNIQDFLTNEIYGDISNQDNIANNNQFNGFDNPEFINNGAYIQNEQINNEYTNYQTNNNQNTFVPIDNINIEPNNIIDESTTKKKKEKKKLFSKKDKKVKQNNSPKQEKQKIEKNKNADERPKASKRVKTLAAVMVVILIFCFIGVLGATFFAIKLCDNKPTLNVTDLIAPDSSTIYDNEGNKIMQVGMYLRENISYDEMPNCLIDAFVAIEDSRFFEHYGFDIPRFTKSAIGYVTTGGEFAQGGSTLTMQLIKNTYYTKDAGEDSTIAAREGMSGIKRKMQEIVLSTQLELFTKTSKKDIISMYINKVNYGDNIRGVEKAAEYYFGKSAKQLGLSESAFLAGIVNSPASYNPYGNIFKEYSAYYSEDTNYLEKGTERRNEVLNLMLQHGYITENECKLAKSIKLEDQLVGPADEFANTNDKYQWYIDAVIDEVEEMTGESPYYVGMNIYTNMNPYMQEFVYDLQNEEEYTGIKFPNELCQSAIVLMDNQTGAVEALGGGRGQIDSARQFNRATSAYLNPGSSIKPVVDYSLAIEHLGWSTSHTITDQPYYLYSGNVLVANYDRKYHGDMMMTEALGRSQNTPAVQTLQAVVDEIGEDAVIDYLNSIGFKFEYEDFDLQFAIGGNRCLATPEQMAGAHAIFMNGGMYIKPHTINYIDYVDGRDDYVADTVGTRALSEEAAWITQYLERYNMEGSYSSLMWYCKRKYPLYGKTGTTDWADAGVEYGIPVSSTKDSWLVMQTNRYTISCWTGYDELQKGAYFTYKEYHENTKSKIVSAILDQLETHATYEDYDPFVTMEKPEGVVQITHVKGTYPYARGEGEQVKGYIKKEALDKRPLASINEALNYSNSHKKKINNGVIDISGTYDGQTLFVTFGLSSGIDGLISGDECDISTTNVYGETTHASGRIWFPHWYSVYSGSIAPPYSYKITIDGSNDNEIVVAEGQTLTTNFVVAVPGYRKLNVTIWTDVGNETSAEISIS